MVLLSVVVQQISLRRQFFDKIAMPLQYIVIISPYCEARRQNFALSSFSLHPAAAAPTT